MKRGFATALGEFLRLEAAGGILLAGAALCGLALANSPLAQAYIGLLGIPVEIRAANFEIAKPLLLWINDGLMTVFFLLVGLELKREILRGELSRPSQIALPAIAALGGMAVPGLIYASLNWGDPVALAGWAIPTATDIAFAIGVLSLLGARVPGGLKLFLLTLAILDDLGAILIIAIYYSGELAAGPLIAAALMLALLFAMNLGKVESAVPYVLVGFLLWASVLKSGVHATLAGVALALFIPERAAARLERELHPAVAFAILPAFAFANAGVPLHGLTVASLAAALPLGIALGLVAGKLAGVFGASFLAIRLRVATLPTGATWLSLLGVSALCGIGFTMSLFIAGLAFEDASAGYSAQARLGILVGSLVSALVGYFLLRLALSAMSRAAQGRSSASPR